MPVVCTHRVEVTTPPAFVDGFGFAEAGYNANGTTFPIVVDAALIAAPGEYAALYAPTGQLLNLGTPIATLAWLGGTPPPGLSFGPTVSFGVRTISGTPRDCILFTVV